MAISELLVSGALGSAVQARTSQQIADSGSLLLGGRPEWTVTLALMQHAPLGLGLGTVPNATDLLVAKDAIAVAHIPTAQNYLEHYLFNGSVELHSVIADLWTNLGVVGLLLGLTILVLLVGNFVVLLGRRRAHPLACFVVVAAVWYLAFGPLLSNLPDVMLALGVVLQLRRTSVRTAAGRGRWGAPLPGARAEEDEPAEPAPGAGDHIPAGQAGARSGAD
jgi:hypothetical protein